MSIDDYFITRLSDEDIDNLVIFDCYNENEHSNMTQRIKKKIRRHSQDMNDFIQNEAMEEQSEGYNTTFLVKNSDNFIIAYMSLCSDAIKLDYSERDNGQIGYETFPSLKIARLAVHKDHQKSGIGKLLIDYAVAKTLNMRENICGVKFITLDCFSHRLSYYTTKMKFVKNNEQANNGDSSKPISLRLHIDDYLDEV
jgi:GNAT superfamily N-acetyltransferase